MSAVEIYIAENLIRTFKPGKAGMKPFTVPCIGEMFTDFYYWDTYFTNFALLALGDGEQVQNNLDNMKHFVEELGYIPNSDITTNRSQPPLFARGVYDYYCFCGRDRNVAKRYLPAMIKEHGFWMRERMLPCGLNGYKHNATKEYLVDFCSEICERVGEDAARYQDKVLQGAHFLAIAESGWDFTPRFESQGNRYAGMDYAPVDLNAILYDAERIIAELSADTGDESTAAEFFACAEQRAALMNQYMAGENGFFYDYNAEEQRKSTLLHAGMFMPFAVGLLSDGKSAEKLLSVLRRACGVAACEERTGDKYDQWDFPAVWAPLMYFCAEGLRRSGSKLYRQVAEDYLATVDRVFAATGKLWEKYDAATGMVAGSGEYATPPMLGWTAGVYLWLKGMINNQREERK